MAYLGNIEVIDWLWTLSFFFIYGWFHITGLARISLIKPMDKIHFMGLINQSKFVYCVYILKQKCRKTLPIYAFFSRNKNIALKKPYNIKFGHTDFKFQTENYLLRCRVVLFVCFPKQQCK